MHSFTSPGSLFARILFQPIEESSRVFFGRSAAPALKPSTARSQLNASVELLTTLLHFHLLLGLVLVFFCPPYVRPLLQCVLGDKWMSTPAPALLQTYCYLIPLLGVNGITEAFVQAVASQQELSAVSKWMTVSSVVYAASCCTFCHTLGFGENGLVLANMLSMVVRIFFAFRFTQTWLRQKGHQKGLVWSQVLPPMNVLVAAGLAGHVVRWSVRQYTARATPVALLRHLGVGVLLGLAYVATMFVLSSMSMFLFLNMALTRLPPVSCMTKTSSSGWAKWFDGGQGIKMRRESRLTARKSNNPSKCAIEERNGAITTA